VAGVKDLLRSSKGAYLKKGLVPNINGTGRVPYHVANRLSLQVLVVIADWSREEPKRPDCSFLNSILPLVLGNRRLPTMMP